MKTLSRPEMRGDEQPVVSSVGFRLVSHDELLLISPYLGLV
jgi:hypothetical protein